MRDRIITSGQGESDSLEEVSCLASAAARERIVGLPQKRPLFHAQEKCILDTRRAIRHRKNVLGEKRPLIC
jgi:hypothetical protein